MVESGEGPITYNILFKRLTINTQYVFSIAAVNTRGKGKYSKISFYTNEGKSSGRLFHG